MTFGSSFWLCGWCYSEVEVATFRLLSKTLSLKNDVLYVLKEDTMKLEMLCLSGYICSISEILAYKGVTAAQRCIANGGIDYSFNFNYLLQKG